MLAQEIINRMLNTSEEIPQQSRNKILDDFNNTMEASGYDEVWRRRIFNRGLKGYENIRMLDSKGIRTLQRRGKDTLGVRFRKKLL